MSAIDVSKITHWLIRTDQAFHGHTQSFLTEAGTVAYTDGLTVEEYQQARGFPVRVITNAELDELTASHATNLTTTPTEATAEFWEYALNVLPPCRWHTCQGVELFHVSERITLDLVDWYARHDGRFFHMVQPARTPSEALAAMVIAAA